MKRHRLIIALWLACVVMAIFTIQRMALIAMTWPDLPHSFIPLLLCFIRGWHMDLAMTAVLVWPWIVLLSLRRNSSPGRSPMFWIVLFGWLFGFLFLVLCDLFFFEEFNARFNYIAIDYLFLDTGSVLKNIWQSYPVLPVVGAVGATVGALLWACRAPLARWRIHVPSVLVRRTYLGGGLLLAVALTGSLDIDAIGRTSNRILGEIGANGIYTLGYALLTNHLAYDRYYPTLPQAEAEQRAKTLVYRPDDVSLESTENVLLRKTGGRAGLGQKNVVIILEESFGSSFVGVLRHPKEAVTPFFDRLSAEGLLFTRIYATGTRTVRGLEAVLSSFPPIPGASIVKRKGFGNVASLADVLARRGYETLFVYGGRGIFDNMRPFMLANGFQRFIEQRDYRWPAFTTAWGVSDEDIFNKVIEEADALSGRHKPFFMTVLTVSNHKPYKYPAGRIDLDPRAQRREHAVKYADWALGQFFEKAKTHSFYQETIFVILGDHGARVYGADSIPLLSYEVPLLVYAPPLVSRPRRIDTLGSSMDVAPTILGLLGGPYESTFFGRDLLREPPAPPFALLQHDREIGFLQGHRVTVLSTGNSVSEYQYDLDRGTFERLDPVVDAEATQNAIALYQTAFRLFERGAYRLPAHPPRTKTSN